MEIILIYFFVCISVYSGVHWLFFLPKISKLECNTFFSNITASQHLGVVDPNLLYTLDILLVLIIIEQKQAANYCNYDNVLLDNLNTSIPVDITLSNALKMLCNSTHY